MHSARHRRQSNQKRIMDNNKKICSIKSRYARHRHVERSSVWDLAVEGINRTTIFFRPATETISVCGDSGHRRANGGKERSRKGGWVSCERIHAVEFCILSLAACGLKQHPPTSHRNSHYAKECTRE